MLEQFFNTQNLQVITEIGLGGVAVWLYQQIRKLRIELQAHKADYDQRLQPVEQFQRTGIRYRTLVTKSEGKHVKG